MTKSRGYVKNVNITDANTEYSFQLPTGTLKFTIKLRDLGAELKVCFVSGDVDNYINLSSGRSYTENNIKGQKNYLYFQSPTATQTAEILYWI